MTPRPTSRNDVVSGESPNRIESGSRKSGMTPALDEAVRQAPRIGMADRDVCAAPRRVARASDREPPPGKPSSTSPIANSSRAGPSPDPPDPGLGSPGARPPRSPPARACRASRSTTGRCPVRDRSPGPSRTGRAGRTSPGSGCAARPGARAGRTARLVPRAAVEVLVRAADREVRAARRRARLDRSARVAEVPDDERSGLVGEGGDPGDVGDRGRSVVHVAEGDERDVVRVRRQRRGDVVERRPVDRVGVDPGDLEVPLPGRGPRGRSDRSGSCRGRSRRPAGPVAPRARHAPACRS